MKKKLFLGALLLGALTLNSCVDNVESDSVKSIRQAKAEQLKAKAEFDKAQGEAALIAAQAAQKAQEIAAAAQAAQAEYMKAQAEVERARAAYYEAQAALENAKAESEKATAAQKAEEAAVDLETKKVTLEEKKAKLENYKKQLAYEAAQYEYNLYWWQKQALEAQRELEKAIKAGETAHIDELLALLKDYQDAADDLLQAQKTLATWKTELAKLEAGLQSSYQSIENQIKYYNQANDRLQIKVDAAQAALDIYEQDYSYESAKEAYAEAKVAQADLDIVRNQKSNDKNAASLAAANALYALQSSEYIDAVNSVKPVFPSSSYTVFNNTDEEIEIVAVSASSTSLESGVAGNVCAKITDKTQSPNVVTYIPLFSNQSNPEIKTIKYQQYNNPTVYSTSYDVYTEYYNLIDEGKNMDKFVAALNDFVKNDQEKALADATKAVADQTAIVTPIKALCDKLEPLQKAYDDAVQAKADAVADGVTGDDLTPYTEDVTDAEDAFKAAVKDQKLVTVTPSDNTEKLDDYLTANGIAATVTLCQGAYTAEKTQLDALVAAENRATNALNAAKKTVAEYEADATALKAGNAGNEAAIAAVNKAEYAEAQAYLAYIEADNNYQVKSAEVRALNNIVNGNNVSVDGTTSSVEYWENQIQSWNDNIEQNNDQIKIWEGQLKAGQIDEQTAIENLKADIANQEAKVKVFEEKAKYAKELLDKALEADKAE